MSRCLQDVVLPQTAESVMDGEQAKRMGPGEDTQGKLRYFGHIIRHSSVGRDIIQGHGEELWGRGRRRTSYMNDTKVLTGSTVDRVRVQPCPMACTRIGYSSASAPLVTDDENAYLTIYPRLGPAPNMLLSYCYRHTFNKHERLLCNVASRMESVALTASRRLLHSMLLSKETHSARSTQPL